MAWNARRRVVCLLLTGSLASSLLPASLAGAQTLARPGWAGSGLNGEPWWRSAVFYRVDPQTFQDSDSDGVGDLPGVTSRLDYLQTLGIDALILESSESSESSAPTPSPVPTGSPSIATHPPKQPAVLPFALIDAPGFDDLLTEASHRHLRIIVAQPLSNDTALFLARARSALTRGAAGIELAPPSSPSVPPATAVALLSDLRALASNFPGERVVLSDLDPSTSSTFSASAMAHAARRLGPLRLHGAEAPQLTALSLAPQLPSGPEAAAALRALATLAEALPPGVAPVLQAPASLFTPAGTLSSMASAQAMAATFLAVRLLGVRGALTLDAGQELGLFPPSATALTQSAQAFAPLMQWTPRNITPPAVKIEPNPDPPPARSDVYGAYRPYVPVKPKPVTLPGAPQPPPEPDTLPGFTSGALPVAPSPALDTAHRNVAVEDLDLRSLLNLYRRLIVLHHGHATLRTGSTAVLDLPSSAAIAWVRRAPAGARTVASVIVACNLSDAPVSLSLDAELDRAHVRPGLLRPLLGTAATPNGPQSTASLSLPAHGIYIGEIYHH